MLEELSSLFALSKCQGGKFQPDREILCSMNHTKPVHTDGLRVASYSGQASPETRSVLHSPGPAAHQRRALTSNARALRACASVAVVFGRAMPASRVDKQPSQRTSIIMRGVAQTRD